MACACPKLHATCNGVLPSLPECRQSTSTPGSLSSQFSSRTMPALAALHKRVLIAALSSCCMSHKR